MNALAIVSACLLSQAGADAKSFFTQMEPELKDQFVRSSTADWIKNNFITDDTERMSQDMTDDFNAYLSRKNKEARRFDGQKLDPDSARMLYLLRIAQSLPAPSDAKKRTELASISSKLDGEYGKGKWCGKNFTPGKDDPKKCRDLQTLEKLMAKSTNYDELLDAWAGWHTISRDMRGPYAREVELSNEGARELGFKDLGDLWRSGYDMPPADFEKETDRLWNQVKPLYDQLHCYVRAKLSKKYGADKVKPDGPIPAHLLGNMWAQEWENIYPLVEPYPGQARLDVTPQMLAQHWDPIRMVKLGEAFFVSLGFDKLPETFWERSLFVKPRDREVVCHASAWDVTYSNDLRIKMCIEVQETDLAVIHHELGHDFYYQSYHTLPVLFQQGANDGFHEAIGDSLVLSITPEYLVKIGLLPRAPEKNQKNLINLQMKSALERAAFLPFARMIDQWRWDVFSGKTPPSEYNKHWWELREKYQGVSAPVARSEDDFDPGAKYHIPANVPYMRYFLARILQYQFHRAMCRAAGFKGPLHECSIYGNKDAGAKLKAMLSMGASKPWPDALEALSGERQMDATALLDYYAPLMTWLQEQNKGQKCGW